MRRVLVEAGKNTKSVAEHKSGNSMDDKIYSFFKDDGTPVNHEFVPKPGLCVFCRHDDDPKQENLCTLNHMDQQGEEDFKCDAYEKK